MRQFEKLTMNANNSVKDIVKDDSFKDTPFDKFMLVVGIVLIVAGLCLILGAN